MLLFLLLDLNTGKHAKEMLGGEETFFTRTRFPFIIQSIANIILQSQSSDKCRLNR